MAVFAMTQPRLKLFSAVCSNLVTASIIGVVNSLNSPIYLIIFVLWTIVLCALALNAERALSQFP